MCMYSLILESFDAKSRVLHFHSAEWSMGSDESDIELWFTASLKYLLDFEFYESYKNDLECMPKLKYAHLTLDKGVQALNTT